MNEILAANAALLLVEKLLPLIEQKVKSGEISAEDQAMFRARYQAMRAKGDANFAEVHWQIPAEKDTPQAPV